MSDSAQNFTGDQQKQPWLSMLLEAYQIDVLNPMKKYTDAAFDSTLPFYGVTDKAERKKIIKNGSIHRTVRTLQSCNWQSLAQKMDDYDKRQDDKRQDPVAQTP